MNLNETLKQVECRINNFNAVHSKLDSASRYDSSFSDAYYNKGVVCYQAGGLRALFMVWEIDE